MHDTEPIGVLPPVFFGTATTNRQSIVLMQHEFPHADDLFKIGFSVMNRSGVIIVEGDERNRSPTV